MKNLAKLTALLLLMFFSSPAWTCMNEYEELDVPATHIDQKGRVWNSETGKLLPFTVGYNKSLLKWQIEKVDMEKIEEMDFKDQSDIGIILTRLGDFESAKAIYERLIEKHADEYTINANLGTVYELLGDNESALQYIKKGLELNPASHEGSEWAHVKILEAKIEIAKDPKWLKKNTVFGFGKITSKSVSDTATKNPYADSLMHIDYQLRTRIPFTHPSDAMTATLFKEAGDLAYAVFDVGFAYYYYNMAQVYSPDKKAYASLISKSATAYNKLYVNSKDTSIVRDSLQQMSALYDTTGYTWEKSVYLKEGEFNEADAKAFTNEAPVEEVKEAPKRPIGAIVLGILIVVPIIILVLMLIFRKKKKD